MKLKKGIWFLIAFNALYVLAFTIYYLSIKNYEFIVYIGVLVAIALFILLTLHKSKLDYFVLWGLSIWGLLHMLGGGLRIGGETLYRFRIIDIIDKGGDFYILKMDQAIHFYGFAVAAIVVYQLLAPHFNSKSSWKLPIFIAFIGSMGLGAINEIVEFVAYVSLAETGVGDLYNTGLDLIFNMFGAFAGAVIAHFHNNRKIS